MKEAANGLCERRNERGQTTVETALVISVFLLATLAVTQMASAVFAYNTVCSAARDAVRYASVHGEGSGSGVANQEAAIQQVAIKSAATLNLTTSNVAVSFPVDAGVPSQEDAKVVITYGYKIYVPSLSVQHIITIQSLTFQLTATSQMPVSQ